MAQIKQAQDVLLRPVLLYLRQLSLVQQQQVRSTAAKHLTLEPQREPGSMNLIGLPLIEDFAVDAEVLMQGEMRKEPNRN